MRMNSPARPGLPPAAPSGAWSDDQAQGLRRLFAASGRRLLLPLLANPHVAFSGLVLDRLAAVLAASGRQVLVVDAGAGAPAAHELSRIDLAHGIERISQRVAYLPARGLPLRYVDTRGSAAGFIEAVQTAAPWADTLLLHADSPELARVLQKRSVRPVLLAADHPESVKHAYAGAKLLAQRCGLLSYDLLLVAARHSPRLRAIEHSLAQCLDNFMAAFLHHCAVVDPAEYPAAEGLAQPDEALQALLAAQLALDEGLGAWPAAPTAPGIGGTGFAPLPAHSQPTPHYS